MIILEHKTSQINDFNFNLKKKQTKERDNKEQKSMK